MVRAGLRKSGWMLGGIFCACSLLPAQQKPSIPCPLTETGQIAVGGKPVDYVIRHLPVSSFPALPAGIAMLLNRRGCLIPQTYEARGPENVIHASLERPGSSDWAVLCSAQGVVSLLVFFSGEPPQAQVLVSAPETERLQTYDPSGVLGFNWGIDPASPQHIHEVQTGMEHRPPRPDHDALADSVIEHKTVYHFYSQSAWSRLDVPD